MPTVRVLRAVTSNFLGAYVSRYTEYEGYWLFGFLDFSREFVFNLLLQPPDGDASATGAARVQGARRFAAQLAKARLSRAELSEAHVALTPSAHARQHLVAGVVRTGHDVTFRVTARATSGRVFEATCSRFISRHDPLAESRSARAGSSAFQR